MPAAGRHSQSIVPRVILGLSDPDTALSYPCQEGSCPQTRSGSCHLPCPHSPPNQGMSLWLSLTFSEPQNVQPCHKVGWGPEGEGAKGMAFMPPPASTPSMASSWTLALPTHPCSSTSGQRTRRMTLALWASTAPVTCAVSVPPSTRCSLTWIHTHCRASGALCSLRLCRPSSQAPLLAARWGLLQAGAAGAPKREAGPLGLGGAVGTSILERRPRYWLGGLGLAWPKTGLYTPDRAGGSCHLPLSPFSPNQAVSLAVPRLL